MSVQESGVPEGNVGPLSIARANINGIPCTALLCSGSQVTIVFDSWYAEHLSHVPLHLISGLNLWGLIKEDSSYSYWGYIQIALELPEKTPGKKTQGHPCSCFDVPRSPLFKQHFYYRVGTNVSKVRLSTSSEATAEPDNIWSLRVCILEPKADRLPATQPLNNDPDDSPPDSPAEVKWSGPGPLVVPAGSEYIAVCKV